MSLIALFALVAVVIALHLVAQHQAGWETWIEHKREDWREETRDE